MYTARESGKLLAKKLVQRWTSNVNVCFYATEENDFATHIGPSLFAQTRVCILNKTRSKLRTVWTLCSLNTPKNKAFYLCSQTLGNSFATGACEIVGR